MSDLFLNISNFGILYKFQFFNLSVSDLNVLIFSVAMILQIGNTVIEEGIAMTFPPDAFPDSLLTITWGEASPDTKAVFDDTTSAFQAVSITNLTSNAIHFIVENPPLSTPDIVYNTIIPIPDELLDPAVCPDDYGYEIFTQMTQTGFNNTIFPIFVLFESFYDPDSNPKTLTTDLFPEMFTSVDSNNPNGSVKADIIMSCTPGVNIMVVRRRNLLNSLSTQIQFEGNKNIRNSRLLLQVSDYSNCKATPILCPLESKYCHKAKPYGRDHYGVDYKAANENVIATANGVIERSEISQTYGELIIMRHDDGSATVYANLHSRALPAGMLFIPEIESTKINSILYFSPHCLQTHKKHIIYQSSLHRNCTLTDNNKHKHKQIQILQSLKEQLSVYQMHHIYISNMYQMVEYMLQKNVLMLVIVSQAILLQLLHQQNQDQLHQLHHQLYLHLHHLNLHWFLHPLIHQLMNPQYHQHQHQHLYHPDLSQFEIAEDWLMMHLRFGLIIYIEFVKQKLVN